MNESKLVGPKTLEVWLALREHGPASAHQLHTAKGWLGRSQTTGERMAELLEIKAVRTAGHDTSRRGLPGRIFEAVGDAPGVRPPKGAELDDRVLSLLREAGGTMAFSDLKTAIGVGRDGLMASCTRLLDDGKVTKSPGSRPSYTLAKRRARPSERNPSALRLSERLGTVMGPSGRRLAMWDDDDLEEGMARR